MRSKGKHVWATHKCGCSLALNVWGAVKKDIDYRFLLARNPYNRLVSFYADKIIGMSGNHARSIGIRPDDYVNRGKVNRVSFSMYLQRNINGKVISTNMPKDIDTISFKSFCKSLHSELIFLGDPHVRRQTDFCADINPDPYNPPNQLYEMIGVDAPKDFFNDILWLEHLPQCFEIPAKKLEVDLNLSEEYLKIQGKNRNENHITDKSESLNNIDNAWDKTSEFWWKTKKLPKNYDILYDDELIDLVYNLYKVDFDYFGLEKGQFVI